MKRYTKIICLSIAFCSIIMLGFAQPRGTKQTSKFVYQSSLSFASGVSNLNFEERSLQNRIPVFGIQQILAYQFNSYIFTGIGTGLDIWKHTAFIPLFANVSVNFTDKKIAPHWYANIGYSFKWYMSPEPESMTRVIQGSTPGLYGESGFGINVKLNDKVALLVLANYKMQNSKLKYSVAIPGEPDFSQYSTNRSKSFFYHFVGLKVAVLY